MLLAKQHCFHCVTHTTHTFRPADSLCAALHHIKSLKALLVFDVSGPPV